MLILEHILEVIRTTKAHYILAEKGEEYVILPLKSYEKLAKSQKPLKDLTEEELLASINRTIAQLNQQNKDEEVDFIERELMRDDFEQKYYIEPIKAQ